VLSIAYSANRVKFGLVRAGNAQAALNTLKDANADWGAYRRVAALDRRELAADLGAAGEHSGTNLGNKLRQQLRSMYLGSDRGFTPEESDAIERVVRGSMATNALRMASNFMGGGGGLGSHALGLAHVATMGPAGVAVPLTGMVLRRLANRNTLDQFDQLQRSTALRSALGRRALAALPAPRPAEGMAGPAMRTLLAMANGGQQP
jgi:hypothetical protein